LSEWSPNLFWGENTEGRQGRCYELAFSFVKDFDDVEGELVHGTIYVPKDEKRIHHAWVELKSGLVYEPVTNSIFEKKFFYKVFKPQDQKRYTRKEAMIKAVTSKHYGPWE